MSDNLYFTKKGFERANEMKSRLFDELKKIQGGKGEAAEVGGNEWHDNFAFEQLCRDEDMLNKRIAEFLKKMKRAVLVDDFPDNNDFVRIGTIVTLYNETEDKELVYEVGGHGDTNLESNPPIVAYDAPIMRPFFLKDEGTVKKVPIRGKVVEISVEKIELRGD
ncbi:MAG: hypothetical protein CR972_04925 [Candidatus Moraniibacteriota bacterium]|nr:MAG: hypothetical protein CR972_04925 [Candidatus Moranbacteria bacterium]